MTKPKYESLKDVPKYQYYGKKQYPIPMKKRIEMYLRSIRDQKIDQREDM